MYIGKRKMETYPVKVTEKGEMYGCEIKHLKSKVNHK